MAELAHGFVVGAADLFGDEVSVRLESSQDGGKLDRLNLRYAGA